MASNSALEQKFRQAVADHAAGRLAEADAGYRKVLKKDPRHLFARHYLGVLCHQGGRLEEALPLLEASTAKLGENAGCRVNLANLYKDLGRLAEAEKHYRAARRLDPALALAGFNLGQLCELRGDLAAAEEAYRSAAALPQAQQRLAVLTADRDPAGDAALLAEALPLLAHAGENARCEAVIARLSALGDASRLAEAGATLARSGFLPSARAALAAALELAPAPPAPRAALALVLNDLGRYGEATALAQQGLALGLEDATLHLAHADALKELGRLDEADRALQQALVLAPQRLDVLGSLQQLRLCRDGFTPAAALASARTYGDAVNRHAPRPAALQPSPAAGPRASRLRLGILSGELGWTPVGRFMAGFLRHYPRERIELTLFSDRRAAPDPLGEAFRKRAQRSVDCADWSDERLAEAIQATGCDLLLELTGHAGANRMPMLSWRPAPRQGSFLGYAGTTGAPGLDFRIADAITEPDGAEAFSSEPILRLPGSYFCFDPACQLPPVAPTPALANGYLTFGCFVQRPKIGDRVLSLWIRLLAALPAARMQLRCRSFGDRAAADAMAQRIASLGGDPARFDLLPWGGREDFLANYAAIDVGLNSFPFQQATNLCDALWMGVPTLSLSGELHCSRMADSICAAAGLEGWCHRLDDALLAAGIEMAADPAALDALRRGLRQRVERSALADQSGFAARLSALLLAA